MDRNFKRGENDMLNDTEYPIQINTKFNGPQILKFSNE